MRPTSAAPLHRRPGTRGGEILLWTCVAGLECKRIIFAHGPGRPVEGQAGGMGLTLLGGVRCLKVRDPGSELISAGADGTVKRWVRPSGPLSLPHQFSPAPKRTHITRPQLPLERVTDAVSAASTHLLAAQLPPTCLSVLPVPFDCPPIRSSVFSPSANSSPAATSRPTRATPRRLRSESWTSGPYSDRLTANRGATCEHRPTAHSARLRPAPLRAVGALCPFALLQTPVCSTNSFC